MYITDSSGKRRKITPGTREMGNIFGITEEVLPPTKDEIIDNLNKRIKQISESRECARDTRTKEHNRVIELDNEKTIYRTLFFFLSCSIILFTIIYYSY